MKHLEDFADDINKCSKCGLCQSVCPVYKITGNDCAVSRGKFVMLDGVLKGDLQLDKNIEKYIDMCMKCGKCKAFCPSSIDICEIFYTAKALCVTDSVWMKFVKFLQSKLVFSNFLNVFDSLSHILFRVPKTNRSGKTKLLYFKGCVNKVFPKTEVSLKKVFSSLNVEIIEKAFDCCGLPFLSDGNIERYKEVMEHNLKQFHGDFDYILTDCASCESTLNDYKKSSKISPNLLNFKTVNAAQFVAKQDVKFIFKEHFRVTFHKPCHLQDADFIAELMQKCDNIEYVQMKDYDECCGFAGEFALKNPKISSKLAFHKAENILNSGADIVLTTCPACVLGIMEGFALHNKLFKNFPKVMNVMEFLAMGECVVKK